MSDVVLISLEAWDDVWRRNQHLVSRLLARDESLRVLFVEPASDPLHAALHRRAARPGRGLREGPALPGVGGRRLWLYQPTKLLPRRVDPRVDRRWATQVIRAARRTGMTDPVLWVNDPGGAAVLEVTGWPAIYDVTDDWLRADRTVAEHARLARNEAMLMRRCATVVVCSPVLADRKGTERDVVLIPNAVDVEAYRRPLPRPTDLPSGPVALYAGTVHTDRVDVDLCARVAREIRGRGTLVFVGPDLLARGDHDRLTVAGAVLLGGRPSATVPAYLQHADVLVVPHLVNAFTRSLDPIKAYEYAAVGRPVVSTDVPGFADDTSGRVTVAAGADFARAVASALPSATEFPDGADGSVPTWDDRASEFADVLTALERGGRA